LNLGIHALIGVSAWTSHADAGATVRSMNSERAINFYSFPSKNM